MARRLDDLLHLLADISQSRDTRPTLTALAKQVHVSPWYFQKMFTKVMGESPKQYSRRLQLEYAAALLLTTERPILHVALSAGFESHEGFTRAFAGRFGASPAAYRKREPQLQDRARLAKLIAQIGPCVHLFRRPQKERSTMKYEITTQPVAEMTFLFRRATCAHSEISTTLGQLLPDVFRHATANGIEMVGPPTTLYMSWGPGVTTIHAGLPVVAGAEGGDGIEVATIAASSAAVTIHTGPYDGLHQAHAALEMFLHEQKLTAGRPVREVYLTDPGEVPDPNDWKTQICWPFTES